MSNFDWDAVDTLGSDEYENAVAAPLENKKRYLRVFDYDRLKKDTGIEKFKFEVSSEDHEGYLFDFLPYPVSTRHPKYQSLKRVFGDHTPLDWKLNVILHKVKSPHGEMKVICPEKTFGHDCPFCDEKRRLFDEGGDWDKNPFQTEIKALNDVERDFFLVRNREDGKVYVMEYATFFFGQNLANKLARTKRGERSVVLAKPTANGHSLRFWVDPSTRKDSRGKPIIGKITDIEFERRDEAIPSDILENLPVLDQYLIEYSYDDMSSMLDGTFFINSGDDEGGNDEAAETVRDDQRGSGRDGSDDSDGGSRSRRRTRVSGSDDSESGANDDASPTEEDSTPTRRQKLRKQAAEETDDNPVATPLDEGKSSIELEREERRRRRREGRKTTSEKPTCPAGGEFGKDIDTFDECDDCPVYSQCDREYKRLNDENEELSVI